MMNSTKHHHQCALLLELVIVLISAVLIPGCEFKADSVQWRIQNKQEQIDATSMLKGDYNE